MPYLLLQRCSKCGKHRAPACRHGARRAFGHLPLPRFRHLLLDVATTRCCATDIVRRRERSLAATRILCPRPPMTQFGATIGSNPGPAAPSQRSQAWPCGRIYNGYRSQLRQREVALQLRGEGAPIPPSGPLGRTSREKYEVGGPSPTVRHPAGPPVATCVRSSGRGPRGRDSRS